MSETEVFESPKLNIASMGAIALNLNHAPSISWHIREVQIAVAVREVTHFPFRVEIVEMSCSRVPYAAQKFHFCMSEPPL
jgi:hypothetical protein